MLFCNTNQSRADGWCWRVLCVALLLAACDMQLTTAYSVQEENPLVVQPPLGQKGLYFGFSLDHYKDASERWLLVGAPRANASTSSFQNVANPGVLYRCQLDGVPDCREVPIEYRDNHTYNIWVEEEMDGQGLGHTLVCEDETIVVCAPRWYGISVLSQLERYLPSGMCFAARVPDLQFESFANPFDGQSVASMSYITTGSCQFGMSAAYMHQDTFAVGAPGCWSWQGDTWEIELNRNIAMGSRNLEKLSKEDMGLDAQFEGHLINLYLGYSVAGIKLGDRSAIVSSMPRTVNTDDVKTPTLGPFIFILIPKAGNDNNKLEIHQKISPPELPEHDEFIYFGYCLATLDLNGDGLEDLVVGAPFYHNSTHHDQGAIFVYMQTVIETENGGSTKKVHKMRGEEMAPQRTGIVSFSRFGSSVAAIGDLDGDGYQDLAVGAPYMTVSQNDQRTGAVYIYMGSHVGLEKDAKQIVKASAPHHTGFGFSIAQRLPSAEGRGYDVAVGIHASDTVLVFKSKEVVDITWNLTFSGPIDLTSGACICYFTTLCPCVDAELSFEYQKKVSKGGSTKLDIIIRLSTSKDLFFENNVNEINRTIELQENKSHLEKFKVMAKRGLERYEAFAFNGEVNLAQDYKEVIIYSHSDLHKKEKLNILVQCDSTEISGCDSDIILSYEILSNYILMGSQPIEIQFGVENYGEPAYDTILNIKSDDEFTINSNPSGNATVKCDKNNKNIACSMGILFNSDERIFRLKLTPTEKFFNSLKNHEAFFSLKVEVTAMTTIINPTTATQEIQVPIIVPGSLSLNRVSQPSLVYFNSSSYYKSTEKAEYEEELGPEIKHLYNILNSNDYSIYAATLQIFWPLKIDEKYFLYLMEIDGIKESCQYTDGEVNPHGLKSQVNKKTSVREFSNSTGKTSALIAGITKSPDYMMITCNLGEVKGNEDVTVTLRSRLVLQTLVQLEVGTAVRNATSSVDLWVTEMPLGAAPPDPSHTFTTTEISYQRDSPEATVPIYVFVLAGLGGLLLLGIIILIMWKCGFFKRQRVTPPENVGITKEREEEEQEEEEVQTPLTPMLKETESAQEDFEFSRS